MKKALNNILVGRNVSSLDLSFLIYKMGGVPSVQFSHSVVSDSLRPQEPQHARPPCPSPTTRIYPNSCPLSQWCHPAISSSVIPFSSCPQSFPASGSFPVSQFFALGGQSIGVSAATSVLPVNTQDWSPLGWTGCISLQSKEVSRCTLDDPRNLLKLQFIYLLFLNRKIINVQYYVSFKCATK